MYTLTGTYGKCKVRQGYQYPAVLQTKPEVGYQWFNSRHCPGIHCYRIQFMFTLVYSMCTCAQAHEYACRRPMFDTSWKLFGFFHFGCQGLQSSALLRNTVLSGSVCLCTYYTSSCVYQLGIWAIWWWSKCFSTIFVRLHTTYLHSWWQARCQFVTWCSHEVYQLWSVLHTGDAELCFSTVFMYTRIRYL